MVSAKDVVAGYIQLKNALASDNSEAAATAGNDLNKALQFMDSSAMSKDQLQIFTDVADDAKRTCRTYWSQCR